jgi:uncharacterized protein
MKGMNASTGCWISGDEHLRQSIGRILSTPLASCLGRRDFGSALPDLIDAPVNGALHTRLYAAIATALMRWEPRIKLTRVVLQMSDTVQGAVCLDIEGWRADSEGFARLRVGLPSGAAA